MLLGMYGSIRSGSCECMDRLGRVVKNVDRLWCCSPLFAFSLIACSLLFICRMDADNSFNLEMRIVTPNSRARWFSLNKVVDAELTNFEDLVRDVVDKYPPDFGEVARLFYFCNQSKVNVEVRSDQDMREMFAKSNESKCCFLTVAYNRPTSEPHIPDWDLPSLLKPHSLLQSTVIPEQKQAMPPRVPPRVNVLNLNIWLTQTHPMSMWVLMRKGCTLTLAPNIPHLPNLTVKFAVSKGSLKVVMVQTVMTLTMNPCLMMIVK